MVGKKLPLTFQREGAIMWVFHGERFTPANGCAPWIWVFCYEWMGYTTSVNATADERSYLHVTYIKTYYYMSYF